MASGRFLSMHGNDGIAISVKDRAQVNFLNVNQTPHTQSTTFFTSPPCPPIVVIHNSDINIPIPERKNAVGSPKKLAATCRPWRRKSLVKMQRLRRHHPVKMPSTCCITDGPHGTSPCYERNMAPTSCTVAMTMMMTTMTTKHWHSCSHPNLIGLPSPCPNASNSFASTNCRFCNPSFQHWRNK